MAVLKPTEITGTVETVLVNANPDEGLATAPVPSVNVTFEGFTGDTHASYVREACVRTRLQYDVGTPIRNTRQITIISKEEMAVVAEKMGLGSIKPDWLGANLLVSGIPNFTTLPPSSRLIFSSGASLVVDMENEPCKYPGEVIKESHPELGGTFAYHARGLRGVTAWVEREGTISAGDTIDLHIPPQRIYNLPGA